MKRIVRIFLILLSGIILNMPLCAQEHAKKKVAVYMTGSTSDAAYKKVIGAKLVNAITESGEYAAVERTADFLAALSAESDYQTSGEVRDSQIARLGQKFGVRYVVVADASELFDEYFIAARLINVETGLVERSFDVNGPADSMSQLVSLSKDVAAGLLGKQLSNSTGSANPIHLSLCVMDRNGVYKYITAEQWRNMPEEQKLNLTKLGVCISENGTSFLLNCREMLDGPWLSNVNLPTIWQWDLIYKYKVPLNNVMMIFGGDVIRDGRYWAGDYSVTEYARYVQILNGVGECGDFKKEAHMIRRTVSALPN